MKRVNTMAAIGAGCILSMGAMASAGVILSDAMEYENDTALQAVWSDGVGGAPTVVSQLTFVPTPLANSPQEAASGKVMRLGNSVRFRELGQAVTESWSLEAKLLNSNYARSGGVYLLNEDGTKGYGVIYDASVVTANSGQGAISIRKIEHTSYSTWAEFGAGASLISRNAGHPALGFEVLSTNGNAANDATYSDQWQDMLPVKLTWESTTGELKVFANGNELASVTDQSFSSFSRVYVRGNDHSYIDDVTVSVVPEPASAGLLGLGGLALTWRARSRNISD